MTFWMIRRENLSFLDSVDSAIDLTQEMLVEKYIVFGVVK